MKHLANTSRLSLTSLHNAARRGDSTSLQRLIATIDPLAAEKIAAVLRDGDSRGACISSPRTAAAPKNKVKGKGAGRTTSKLVHAQGKSGGKKKKTPSRLKRLLQKQDSKRRTALYVACASGNTEIADALLTVGASLDGHGAWQRTPLHIAAFEGHTSAMRRLLGAGADPWALNDRGQTPSEVSQMFNANREALGLLEEAAIMRREVSTGTEGLIGTTFVHDDGQVGTVVDAVERWAFTLEVELDGWKMVNGSGAKLYLPVPEVGLAAGLGAVGHHGDRERYQGEDGSKATISCATPRGPENAGHGHRQVGPSGECSTRRCLSARLVQVASKRGVSRRHREQRASSEDSWAKDGDTDDESGAPDDWSVGTESAAEFDACVATPVNERTREGFGSQRAGIESRSTNRREAPSQGAYSAAPTAGMHL
ncbi:Ankyrin repeat domain protein [Ectocarpus siliculosus]|uniref:Ankyrin repeat domain protein n=1 Tax=Ectocarpus siliculosus TaxID=2880 RepID=D7FIG7_ECTSI|nr:Ankyrin repeat domain protein [Ectocarpus siliculosus]|eukprot:CBJ28790.1 Ankyrin repeat domain protein [Ectocarpus siliculosus]